MLYLDWARSILCEEEGVEAKSIYEFNSPKKLALLLDILWPTAKLQSKVEEKKNVSGAEQTEIILDYLTSVNIKHDLSPKSIADGNVKSLLDLLWLIILHFSIHSPKVNAFQRNVKLGCRMVLNWCREMLAHIAVNHFDTLVDNIANDCILIDLITSQCTASHDTDTEKYLDNCLTAAQKQLGIRSSILSARCLLDRSVEEETLLIYLALLRRKIRQRQQASAPSELAVRVTHRLPLRLPQVPPPALAWRAEPQPSTSD